MIHFNRFPTISILFFLHKGNLASKVYQYLGGEREAFLTLKWFEVVVLYCRVLVRNVRVPIQLSGDTLAEFRSVVKDTKSNTKYFTKSISIHSDYQSVHFW